MANQAPQPPTRPWFRFGALVRPTPIPASAAPAPPPVAPQAQPIRPILNSFLPAVRPPSTTNPAPPQPPTPARPPSPTVVQPPQTSRPTLSPSSSTTTTTTTTTTTSKSPSTPPQATRLASPLAAANAKTPSTPPQATRLTSPLAANAKYSPPPSFSRPVNSSPAKPVTPLSPNPGTSPILAAAAKLNSSTPTTTSPVQPSPRRSPPPVVFYNNGIPQSYNSPLKSSSNSTPPPGTVTAVSVAGRNGTGSPTAASAKPTTIKTSSTFMTASRSPPPTLPNATTAADSNKYATPPPKPSTASPPSPFALPPSQLKYPTTEEEPKRVPTEDRTFTTNVKPKVFRNAPRAVEPSANIYQEKNLITNDDKTKETYNNWFKMHSDSEDGHGGGTRIITIAGENKGAVMEVGYSPRKHNNKYQTSTDNPQGNNTYYYNNSGRNNNHSTGGNGVAKADNSNVAGRGGRDQNYQEQQQLSPWNGSGAYLNSNVQGVNNSILFNTSYTHHDPGLHLSFSRKPASSHYNGRGGIRSSNYQNNGQHANDGTH